MATSYSETLPIFDKQVRGRFPGWQPNEMELSDWLAELCKYQQQQIAQAMHTYAVEHGKYKTPNLAKVAAILRSLATGGRKTYRDPTVHFWLVRERDGAMKPYCAPPGQYVGTEQILRYANHVAKQWTTFHKETWFVVISDNYRLHLQYDNCKYPVFGQGEQESAGETPDPPASPCLQDDPESGMMSIDEISSPPDMSKPLFDDDIPF